MKIAVTHDNGTVFQHFGHTEEFKVYEVQDGAVTSSRIVGTQGQGHGALAAFLNALGVDTLICGGIGAGARQALAGAGVRLYGGVKGNADDAVRALLDGTLSWNPAAKRPSDPHECGSDGRFLILVYSRAKRAAPPFCPQRPFSRMDSRYSDGERPVSLLKLLEK